MAKLKPLLPSLREKKRYIAYEIISEHKLNLSADMVEKSILESSLDYMGDYGMSKAGVMVMKNKYRKQKGIIRVANKSADNLRASLALITHVNNTKVIVRSVGMSGILKKADNYLSG